MGRSAPVENLLTVCGVNYELLAVMQMKQPNGQLIIAVDYSQQLTIASETVDPIDWQLPHLYRAVHHKRHLHGENGRYKSRV